MSRLLAGLATRPGPPRRRPLTYLSAFLVGRLVFAIADAETARGYARGFAHGLEQGRELVVTAPRVVDEPATADPFLNGTASTTTHRPLDPCPNHPDVERISCPWQDSVADG